MAENLLARITTPHQLRRLSEPELTRLAAEMREKIIDVVSRRGGHLASNLGVAELTIALHYVFDFTSDRLLWDVGHQCYAHKLITGRGAQFETLRQANGLSGFPAPGESPYDLFSCGHAGTAISTAAGLAWADQQAGRRNKTVAVVGDASIVNGLSLEGLNNAAMLQRQFLIVLNDNSMAIDRTRGAMAHALDRIRMTQTYSGFKQSAENVLQRVPMGKEINEAIRNIKAGLKTTLHGGPIFEALGLEYFGPIDGHDIHSLIRILRRMAEINKPVLLHVHTQKGRGAEYAVEDPCRFHSPSAYRIENGQAVFEKKAGPSWTSVFGSALADIGTADERIVAMTAAMPDGAGLTKFREKFPARYIDVGICESHGVAMAAGMAKAGLRPVVAIYSTFMQRAMDQVFQEVCLQDLPVLLCMDRAGLVGSDGAVHHGFCDIAMLRMLPRMVLMAPADAAELRAAMDFALALGGPAAIRYPRDEASPLLGDACPPFELGKARVVRPGGGEGVSPSRPEGILPSQVLDAGGSAGETPGGPKGKMPSPLGVSPAADMVFLCYGTMTEPAMDAADLLAAKGIHAAVVNARFAKPLDVPLISRLIASGKPVLTLEDHSVIGGFGAAVLEMAASRGLPAANVRVLGIPDRFVSHASRQQQLRECGLDAASLAAAAGEIAGGLSQAAASRFLGQANNL